MLLSQMAVYVGRFSPLHLGHESVIRAMIDEVGSKNILVVIGSATESHTDRNPYSYKERRSFIHAVFPDITIVPIGDTSNDAVWMQQLDDLVSAFFRSNSVVYYVGDRNDGSFYSSDRNVKVIDRKSVPISGTLVRECIQDGSDISSYVNPKLLEVLI
jgi:cytidyltransferase-like protein